MGLNSVLKVQSLCIVLVYFLKVQFSALVCRVSLGTFRMRTLRVELEFACCSGYQVPCVFSYVTLLCVLLKLLKAV